MADMLRVEPNARSFAASLALAILMAACSEQQADSIESEPGSPAFSEIGDEEVLTLGGTEPFWGMVIDRDQLTYSTPDNIEGETITVTRFNGNNGLGIAGELGGAPLAVAITPGECSDGMSDRTFPYTVTVTLLEQTLFGCGYTDKQPYTGGE